MSRADAITLRLDAGRVHVQAWKSMARTVQSADLMVGLRGLPELLGALDQLATTPEWPETARGADLVASVSARWLGHANLPWSSAWIGKAPAQLAARQHLETAGYEVQPDDTVMMDDAPWGEPRLVVLWPGALVHALTVLCASWGCRSLRLCSLATLAWRTHSSQAQNYGLILAEPVAGRIQLSFIRGHGGRPEEVLVRSARADAVDGLIWSILQRTGWQSTASAQTDGATPLPAPVVGFDAFTNTPRPANLATDLATPVRRTAIGALLLSPAGFVAAALLVVAAAATWNAFRFWDMKQASVRKVARHADTEQSVKAFVPSQELQQRIHSVNHAIQGLNTPLVDMMHALAPPRDINVGVLGLELASTGRADRPQTMNIQAESPTPEDMTRYVAFLATRKPFCTATLTHHEALEDPGHLVGGPVYRYTVELEWQR